MYIVVFWVVRPSRWGQYVHPENWYLPTSPNGVTTQKTTVDMKNLELIFIEYHH
jgi:hypothetical protein